MKGKHQLSPLAKRVIDIPGLIDGDGTGMPLKLPVVYAPNVTKNPVHNYDMSYFR